MPDEKKRTRNYDKSPAGQAYRNQYRREHYATITANLTPEFRDRIDAQAQAEGLSRTQLITKAMQEYLDRQKDG